MARGSVTRVAGGSRGGIGQASLVDPRSWHESRIERCVIANLSLSKNDGARPLTSLPVAVTIPQPEDRRG